jgi:hypothetical protein
MLEGRVLTNKRTFCKPFEAKARLNNIKELSPYRKQINAFPLQNIIWLLMFKDKDSVYNEKP